MRINNRILIKDDDKEVDIRDGSIIQYTGIYYKTINEIDRYAQIKTMFIGVVETERSNCDDGVTGIYIKPLYIWNNIGYEWLKIVDYEEPKSKYFLYPHLLLLPGIYYNYCPLYFLDTVENKSLNDFADIRKEFRLDN